jgi:hypothetical protein
MRLSVAMSSWAYVDAIGELRATSHFNFGLAAAGPLATDCAPTTTYLAIGTIFIPPTTTNLTTQVQWSC